MKARQAKSIVSASVLIFLLILMFQFLCPPPPAGSVPMREIVSYCIGDATDDGAPEMLAIAGSGETDTGERHGAFLLVCDVSAKDSLGRLGCIPPENIWRHIDLSGIKPMKVQLGDINGDGVNEVAVCVYKTAKFHPVMAKRPFFFDLVEGNLIPVWLGSRLSRPFDDYILYDINADSFDEVISIERLESGQRVLAVYGWKGFGFEMLAESEAFDGEPHFEPDAAEQAAETGEINAVFGNRKEQSGLKFHWKDGALAAINMELGDYDEEEN